MRPSLAVEIVRALAEAGVRETCLCPGARNVPLIAAIRETGTFRVFRFFDERSAAFFAIGRIKDRGAPVAVVTTSGTAAAEMLPAALEAFHEGLPLVLVTADRPRRLRGTGAPQTIVQPGLFGVHVETSLDLEAPVPCDLSSWSRARPIHLNVCLEEREEAVAPSVGSRAAAPDEFPGAGPPRADAGVEDLNEFVRRAKYPLVVVGALQPPDAEGVLSFLERLCAPAWLEAPSGLREHPRLAPLRLGISGRLLERARSAGYPVDAVLRVGGVPSLRAWRDLEDREAEVRVLSVTRQPFSGLGHGRYVVAPIGRLLGALSSALPDGRTRDEAAAALLDQDRRIRSVVDALLADEPLAEPSLVRALSEGVRHGSLVYLGNSLPVREWDLAATFDDRGLRIEASRGVNGIDGQVSTFLGLCAGTDERDRWAVVGDLTALYDLQAPWILPQMSRTVRATVAVINNRGGRIFERVAPDPWVRNEHDLSFRAWADLWRLPYERWERVPRPLETSGPRVVEIVPDARATERFWSEHDARVREASEGGA